MRKNVLAMLGLATMFAGVMQPQESHQQEEQPEPKPKPKKRRQPFRPNKPVPKGCEVYYFDVNGNWVHNSELLQKVAFGCVAMNEKSAVKKFNKWLAKQ